MRGKFLFMALIPGLVAGFAALRLLGYGMAGSILTGIIVLTSVAELLRVMHLRDL